VLGQPLRDALETNGSAVKALGDKILRTIARELVQSVRNNVTIEGRLRETVRARSGVLTKRIPRRHVEQAVTASGSAPTDDQLFLRFGPGLGSEGGPREGSCAQTVPVLVTPSRIWAHFQPLGPPKKLREINTSCG